MKTKYILIYHSHPFETFDQITEFDTSFKKDGAPISLSQALQYRALGERIQWPKSHNRFHFGVDAGGNIIPGRSLESPGGACTIKAINAQSIQIVALGNYNVSNPPRKLLESLYLLVDGLRKQVTLPVKRILPGRYFDKTIDSPGLLFNTKRFVREYLKGAF
jgi:hypothetical protein